MSTAIVLYDIPSKSGKPWSNNVWKIRYALGYKGIAFKTKLIEYPDIEPTCKAIGAPPTGMKSDGSDMYTVPVIQDLSTGAVVADSFEIAKYLDKTYPDRPALFPGNSVALQKAFVQLESARGPRSALPRQAFLPMLQHVLRPASHAHFRHFKELGIGMTLEEAATGDMSAIATSFDWVAGYIDENGSGQFIMGEMISFADFVVAGYLKWMQVIWGDSDVWKDISSWGNGRWIAYLDALAEYAGGF
ncbi:hypothetical protein FISHEDRAFT_50050 [Fistulina hepatica ATCC 64428]|uniref:GST N-terminal domain-containing protein n=1 Tax=Fistulina hepatica ATCC 64428 TaxID=1128425 RepID=A0A0D7A247_9AGAR|nr:hypothetical protein FISHEDRAFT_50050 [Fistulina hepatica ATCC 64428]